MFRIIAAAALVVLLSSPAEARKRFVALHPECNVTMPCVGAVAHPRGARIARQVGFGAPVMVYQQAETRPVVRRHRHYAQRPHAQRHRHAPIEVAKATPTPKRASPSTSLDGVVPVLADKVREIVTLCGSEIWSTVRHSFIAGTRIMSQHASGAAVDLHGNPQCICLMLKDWPGGYSTDYSRVDHVHVSYGGREHGARFVHGGGGRRHYARRHYGHRRYASAR